MFPYPAFQLSSMHCFATENGAYSEIPVKIPLVSSLQKTITHKFYLMPNFKIFEKKITGFIFANGQNEKYFKGFIFAYAQNS